MAAGASDLTLPGNSAKGYIFRALFAEPRHTDPALNQPNNGLVQLTVRCRG